MYEGTEQNFQGGVDVQCRTAAYLPRSGPAAELRFRFQQAFQAASFTRSVTFTFTTFGLIMKHRILLGLLLLATISTDVVAQNRTHRRRGIILGGLAGAALGVAIGDKGNNETAGALIGAAAGAFAGGAIGNQKDQRIEQEMRLRSGFYSNEMTGNPHPTQIQRHGYRSQHPLQYNGQTEATDRFFPYRSQPPPNVLPAYNQPYVYPQGRRYLAVPNADPAGSGFGYERRPPRQVVITPDQPVGPLSIVDVLGMKRSGVSPSLILRQIEIHGFQGHLRVADIITLHQSGVSDTVIEAMQIHAQQRHQQSSASFATPPTHEPMPNTAIENILPPPPAPSR